MSDAEGLALTTKRGSTLGKRGSVADYAGEALFAGDLITYAVRAGNRVRMADAVIMKATAKMAGGRLRAMLLVQPTGVDSGYGLTQRETLRSSWISAEHVRLIHSGVMSNLAEGDE
jgi:hypothetical protein